MAARQAELEAAQAAAAAEAAAAKAAAEAEQRRQDELMQKQLREAEQQRLRAEQEAAEAAQLKMLEQERADAERALREKEEAEKAALVPEDNLLEIPVSAEVVAYRDNADVDETELAAVLEELEKAERESLATEQPVAVETLPQTADVLEEEPALLRDEPVDMAPPEATFADTYSSGEKDLFAETEQPRRSLPIPAIAGAIGLVVVIGVGGWFAMSGSSEPPKPAPVVEVAQPQPEPQQEANAANDVITSTQSQTDANTAATVDAAGDQAVASKAAATPKPKKAEPAKNDAKAKKAVTVDDLINDN
jgi:hypothetical protein